MFHRRPRTPSNAHLNPDPSPSAATAAAQAFLANRASNAALSAAAAAAALRNHATTPVPVGELQTKRRLQRQSFSSPAGDAALAGESSVALRRRASSSSMADRSFRGQSPRRAGSVGSIDAPPPVPALPKDIPPVPSNRSLATLPRPATSRAQAPAPSQKTGRRASSVEAGVSRIASPVHVANHGRGMSVDRARATSPGVLAAQRATASRAPTSERGVALPDNRASVNFSYPILPRSPTPSIDERRSNASVAPNQLSPPARLSSPSPAASPGASGPVKGKKKKSAADRNQATSPASVTSGANLPGSGTATPSDAGSPISSPKQRRKAAVGAKLASPHSETSSSADLGSSAMSYHSDLDTISENGDEPERPSRFKTRAAALLVKQPSVVRENSELEAEEDSGAQLNQPTRLDGDSARENLPAQQRQGRSFTAPSTPQSGAQHARSASQPINTSVTQGDTGKDAAGGQEKDMGLGTRPQSLSPTRYAHFEPTPPTLSPLVIKHEPPPRSLSPAKSALRKVSSSRPSSAGSQASNVAPGSAIQNPNGIFDSPVSFAADRSSATSRKKKKGSRVSFDSDSVVVNNDSTTELQPTRISNGSPESPVADTPTSGRRAVSSEAEEEFLRPRPALPLFGSIRRLKDSVRSSSGTANVGGPAPKEASPRLAQTPLGTSSDHAIGGVIAQDFTARGMSGSKVATGLSTDPQAVEPTSSAAAQVDETLYSTPATSDTPSGPTPPSAAPFDAPDDHQENDRPAIEPTENKAAGTNTTSSLDGESQNDVVPSIEFTQPTPNPEAAESSINWGQGQVDPEPPKALSLHNILHGEKPSHSQVSAGIAVEDRPRDLEFPQPPERLSTQDPPAPVAQLEDEDSGSEDTDGSRYSDAAEDVSEPEDGGFGSIDAVVDTTPAGVLPGVAITTPPESATPIVANGKPAGSNKAEPSKNGIPTPGEAQVDQLKIPSTNGSPMQIPSPKVKKRKKVNPNIDGAGEVAVARSVVIRAPPVKQTSTTMGTVTNGISTGNGAAKSPTTGGPTSAVQETSRYSRQNSLPSIAAPKKVTVVAPRGKSVSAAPAKDQFSEAVRKEIRNMTTGAAGALGPPKKGRAKMSLTRSDSNSSASSSSFRKARARRSAGASGSSDGGVTLRRSMRPASHSGPVGESSMSVRSLSPAGSSAPRMMKSSLRGTQSPRAAPSLRPMSADAGKPTSSPFRAFGKGRKAKAAGAPSRFGKKTAQRRYSDSSDDGPRAPPVFRSRFEDSSDDEEGVAIAVPLTPVRGIPRRIGEADDESSELADSSDNEGDGVPDAASPAAAAAAQSQDVAAVGHHHESHALAAGTLRQKARPSPAGSISSSRDGDYSPSTRKKRRSLFGVLGLRKHDSSKDAAAAAAAAEQQQQQQQPGGVGSVDGSGAVNGTAAAVRQRPVRKLSTVDELESWPIPPGLPGDVAGGASAVAPTTTTVITAEQRPSTSDGVSSRRLPWVRRRPHLGVRRTTNPSMSGGLGGGGGDGVRVAHSDTAVPSSSSMRHRRGSHHPEIYGRNGKKKRFGVLRRVFGLVD